MASTANAAKALHRNPQPARAMRRHVVPVIPLAFQKRKQSSILRPKVREEVATPVADLPPVVVELPPSPPAAPETAPSVADRSSEGHLSEKGDNSTVSSPPPATPATPITPAAEESIQEDVVAVADAVQAKVEDVKEEVVLQEEIAEEAPLVPASPPSDTYSSISRVTYQMPPAFVPANHFSESSSDVVSSTAPAMENNHQQLHHTQPSSGNVMFIGYPDSGTSSPAPPHSAGNVQPFPYPQPPLPQPQRHLPPMTGGGQPHHLSNGYSPMGPPPPPGYYPRQDGYNHQGPVQENYARRPMVSFGHPEGYSNSGTPQGDGPRMMNFDPSTPRSFHGSQSSMPNEETGPHFYNQFPPPGLSNESNGHIDDPRFYQHQPPKGHTGSLSIPPPRANYGGHAAGPQMPPPDLLDGLALDILSQFGVAKFADYLVILRYLDGGAEDFHIHGHNLILARSPTLRDLMLEGSQDGSSEGPVRQLVVETRDRFMRSDSFSLALSRLYGGPLLDLQVSQAQASIPGSHIDRFDLALGYAAAGRLLQLHPCVSRGIEVAAHLLQWDTIERAYEFAVDGGLDPQWTLSANGDHAPCPSTYGPAVNILIHAVLNFMIINFPPKFKLDTTVSEPPAVRRLPVVQDPRSSQNARLSFIKFGDHSTEHVGESASVDQVTSVLSKMLLSLPFHLLKYVLENPRLGNVQGWASTALRQEILPMVVQERERRRMKVLSAIHISNMERQHNWDVVGWMEKVETVTEATSTLTRTFVGYQVPDSAI